MIYQALIKCFDKNTDKKQSNKKVYKGKLDWIDEIEDTPIKILVSHQATQLAKAKQTIREFTPPDMIIDINDSFSVSTESLTPFEKKPESI